MRFHTIARALSAALALLASAAAPAGRAATVLPTVTAGPARAGAEVAAGARPKPGGVTIRRSGPVQAASPALTVHISLQGTAHEGDDYTAVGDTVTIPQGKAFCTVVFAVVDDAIPEGTETVVLRLEADAAYRLDPKVTKQVAVFRLTDNDLPRVTIQAVDAELAEPGAAAGDRGAFRIGRDGSTATPLKVSFARGGSATYGRDYTLQVGTARLTGTLVTIPAGHAYANVAVAALDDTATEADEIVTLTLKPSRQYALATLGSLWPDKRLPARPGAAATAATPAPPGASAAIRARAAGDLAIPDTTLPAWEADNQTHQATLTATGGTPPYTWWADNLPAGFSISSDGVLSGAAPLLPGGTTMRITPPFTVTVTDSAVPFHTCTVDLRLTFVASGPQIVTEELPDAIEGEAYIAGLEAEGGTEPYYWYNSPLDGGFLPSWLSLGLDGTLSGTPPAGTAGTGFVFGVCVTDLVGRYQTTSLVLTVVGPPPVVSVADSRRNEGNSGTANLVFTVRLSESRYNPVSVTYDTVDGTATAGDDYGHTEGTLVFNPGQTTRTVSVPIYGDTACEPSETFMLLLEDPVDCRISLDAGMAVGTITNDDTESQQLALTVVSATATFVPQSEYVQDKYRVEVSGTASGPVGAELTFNNGGPFGPEELAITGAWGYDEESLPRFTRRAGDAATLTWSWTCYTYGEPSFTDHFYVYLTLWGGAAAGGTINRTVEFTF